MKVLALDTGDAWIGIAISDALKITCKPLTTVAIADLEKFLEKILREEAIETIVVGNPITMSGGQSEQTKKVLAYKEKLEKQFNQVQDREIKWVLWDERLSSKHAQTGKMPKSKEEKLKEHAVAASYILRGYLDFLAMSRKSDEDL